MFTQRSSFIHYLSTLAPKHIGLVVLYLNNSDIIEIFISYIADILYFCAANLSGILFIKVVGLPHTAKRVSNSSAPDK